VAKSLIPRGKDRPEMAYRVWQQGHNGAAMSWSRVARVSGYPSDAAATMAVRRYAAKNGLPLRYGKSVHDPDRLRLSYCDHLLGYDWDEIAGSQGWANGASACSSVRSYAKRNGLPMVYLDDELPDVWPQSYCEFIMGASWKAIAREFKWSSPEAAKNAVRRYADKHSVPMARLP